MRSTLPNLCTKLTKYIWKCTEYTISGVHFNNSSAKQVNAFKSNRYRNWQCELFLWYNETFWRLAWECIKDSNFSNWSGPHNIHFNWQISTILLASLIKSIAILYFRKYEYCCDFWSSVDCTAYIFHQYTISYQFGCIDSGGLEGKKEQKKKKWNSAKSIAIYWKLTPSVPPMKWGHIARVLPFRIVMGTVKRCCHLE